MTFATNVGQTDRIIRFAIGALLIALTVTGVIGAWGYVGIVPIVTGALRTCPAYALLGINTCRAS